jgi:hypothetical protein
MGKPDYRAYINSPEWKARASYYKALAGNRCRVCNTDTETLDAHHRTYERLGQELDSDITVLCRSCHSLFETHKRTGRTPDTVGYKVEKWLRAIRDWKKFLYGTVVAQLTKCEFDGKTVTMEFQQEHQVLADVINKHSGELAHIFYSVNGERVYVVGATAA